MRAGAFVSALIAVLMGCSPASAEAPSRARPDSAVVPASSQGAREVLAQVRPSVIQIKSFFGSNTAQASHGTGFAVDVCPKQRTSLALP